MSTSMNVQKTCFQAPNLTFGGVRNQMELSKSVYQCSAHTNYESMTILLLWNTTLLNMDIQQHDVHGCVTDLWLRFFFGKPGAKSRGNPDWRFFGGKTLSGIRGKTGLDFFFFWKPGAESGEKTELWSHKIKKCSTDKIFKFNWLTKYNLNGSTLC